MASRAPARPFSCKITLSIKCLAASDNECEGRLCIANSPPGARSSADNPILQDVLIRLMRLERDQSSPLDELPSPRFADASGATDCRDAARRGPAQRLAKRIGAVAKFDARRRRSAATTARNSSRFDGSHGLAGRRGRSGAVRRDSSARWWRRAPADLNDRRAPAAATASEGAAVARAALRRGLGARSCAETACSTPPSPSRRRARSPAATGQRRRTLGRSRGQRERADHSSRATSGDRSRRPNG